jgi:hypothetical protein
LSLTGSGNFIVEVSGQAGTDAAQLYRLEIGAASASLIFEDGFESGDLSRWN